LCTNPTVYYYSAKAASPNGLSIARRQLPSACRRTTSEVWPVISRGLPSCLLPVSVHREITSARSSSPAWKALPNRSSNVTIQPEGRGKSLPLAEAVGRTI
jgi:hypothetical protein